MGVVAETTFGGKDLSEAVAVNEMADAAAMSVRSAIEAAIESLIEGQTGRAMGLMRAALVGLGQHDNLERVVGKLLTEETPAHLFEARSEGHSIIGICNQPDRIVA